VNRAAKRKPHKVHRAVRRKPHKVHRAVRRKPPVTVSIIRVPAPMEKPWELSSDQLAILKNSIAKGASDDELKFCLEVARRYKLDPFRQQIWFIPRWDKNADNGQGAKGRNVYVPQVALYGLLHIAARDHADYGSISLPEYGPMIEVEVDGKKIKGPEWARVKVWKKGLSEPTVGEAYFEEYCPKRWENTLFWRTMGRRMIAKCAKAQGVREAYPDLGGLTIPEEMERMNENFSPSGRELIAEVPQGRNPAEYERLKNRTPEEVRAEAKAFLGTTVQEPKEPRGVIELDWTDEASPIVRGDIAEHLEQTMKLNMHMSWGQDSWWHCEPRDAEALRVICAQFGYELKQILPDKFPAEGAPPGAPAASKQKPGKAAAGGSGLSPASGSKVETPSKPTSAANSKPLGASKAEDRTKPQPKPEKRATGLPRAQIPFVVKAVKQTPSGKGLEVTVDTGAKFYAFDNRKMGEDGEKLLDLLVGAVGKECVFVTSKNQTKDKREFVNIVTALKIGGREWDEAGVPILRRELATREPGED
jgi:RecT family